MYDDRLRHRLQDKRGAVAMTMVLGATAVILLIAAMVLGQVRQELRMAAAEAESAKIQAMVVGVFNETAVRLERDTGWPEPGDLSDGQAMCTPSSPIGTAPYPRYCRQILAPRTSFTLGYEQYPLRVVWQASPGSSAQATYGWIQIDEDDPDPATGKGRVVGIWYHHDWCTPWPDYLTNAFVMGPCKLGG